MWRRSSPLALVAAACASTQPAPVRSHVEVDSAQLSRFVRDRIGPLQACYEAEARKGTAFAGELMVAFDLSPEGRALDVRVAPEEVTTESQAVADCARGVIARWQLPFRPEEATAVSFPLRFSPTWDAGSE